MAHDHRDSRHQSSHAGQPSSRSVPDIDFEAEHDPEAARRWSNMKLMRARQELAAERAGSDAAKAPPGAAARVDRAANESGAPLPDEVRGRFESSLGADLSGVRVHTGSASAAAAESIGAKAYTTGQDIHFGAGQYDPSSKEGQRLLAHEVAHTVQQGNASTAPPQAKLEVSDPANAHELEADQAADAMLAGAPAAVSPAGTVALQRKSATHSMSERYDAFDESWQKQRDRIDDPEGEHVLDGGSMKPVELDGREAGEAGYGARLGNAGTHRAEEALAKGEYLIVAPPVTPQTDRLEGTIGEIADWISQKQAEIEDKKYKPSATRDLFTLGLTQVGKDPSWLTKEKENSIAMAGAELAMCERHMFEHWYWVNSYNAWAPMANQVGAARADLIETAALMGFNLGKTEDMVRFVEETEHGLNNAHELVDAQVLGPKGDISWSNRQDDKGKRGEGPELKGSAIAPLFDDLRDKYEAVTAEQHGVYGLLLDARNAVLEQEKASKQSKVNEINGVIQFWTDITGVVSQAWGPAQGLAHGSVNAKVNEYAAASRTRRAGKQALADAKAGRHASARLHMERSHTAAGHETGKNGLPPTDIETRVSSLEAAAAPKPPGDLGGFNPSLSGVVKELASMAFEGQLNQLQGEIMSLEKQLAGTAAVGKLLHAKQKIDSYANARRQLAKAAQRIDLDAIAQRETQYLDAGDALDRYAIAHASELKREHHGHVVPKDRKHEIYSSLMVVVAKIRAYMMYAETARTMFPYNKFVDAALKLSQERRDPRRSLEMQAAPKSGHWAPPKVPPTSKAEDKHVWEVIDSAYATVFGYSERARIQFGGIEEKVAALLQKMKGVDAKKNVMAENEY